MLLLSLLCALAFSAPFQRPTDVVQWSATAPAPAAKPGGVVKIVLTAKIQPGWKLYAVDQPANGPQPLAITVAKEAPFALEKKQIAPPAPKVLDDANFNTQTRYYEKQAVFGLPVSVGRSVAAGKQTIPLEVTFQACGGEICLRPFTQKLSVDVEVSR